MYQFGAFSTLRDKAAVELLKKIFEDIKAGYIDARLPYIFCNRAEGENPETDDFAGELQEYIKENRLDTRVIRLSSKGSKKEDTDFYEGAMDTLEKAQFRPRETHNLMIGYMKIVPGETAKNYTFINLHPAVPWGPTGKWEDVIWSQIVDESKSVGAMIHIATEKMDRGPVISYTERMLSSDTMDKVISSGLRSLYLNDPERSEELKKQQYNDHPIHKKMINLHKAVRDEQFILESPLLAVTMRRLGEGELIINPEKAILDSSGRPLGAYGICANDLVEEYMKDHGIEDSGDGWDDT